MILCIVSRDHAATDEDYTQKWFPNLIIEITNHRNDNAELSILPVYNTGGNESNQQSKMQNADAAAETKFTRGKSLVWTTACMAQQGNQFTSSSTGSNILTRDNVTVNPDNVGYLTTIVPPNQIFTANKVLNQAFSQHLAVLGHKNDHLYISSGIANKGCC